MKAAASAAGPAARARPARTGPTLVVVESPAKAKTIKKYLGRAYEVKASVGHVMDLPKSKIGVDIEQRLHPRVRRHQGQDEGRSPRSSARPARPTAVLLATDPDREGEAIAWHIAEELGAAGGDEHVRRVLFNEITKNAIQRRIEHPRQLDRQKFDAQQARRILDRLVGYQISPILWKQGAARPVGGPRAVGRGAPGGGARARDRGLRARGVLDARRRPGGARCRRRSAPGSSKVDGQKAELKDGDTARGAGRRAPGARRASRWPPSSARSGAATRRRPSSPPRCSRRRRKLGFTAKQTMTLAQRLYEGVELGDEGAVGLITYMRTDSVRLSAEAVDAVRELHRQALRRGLPARRRPTSSRTKQKRPRTRTRRSARPRMEWTARARRRRSSTRRASGTCTASTRSSGTASWPAR